ncbi:DUF2510 domain-containing protein [Aestuariimicrobium kwangyangense]|uniref:DUF2510 domain-containing protein n=1 Tax=Aestuariimicrobium kwangyangense TaxID=396389 RepID=UPI0003B7B2E4|nr:DUF2510 domain-containing protein [Aestuariimicrobium kwangyangense]
MVGKRGLPLGKGPRAGWYPDPDVSARFRWWDGGRWTTWLSSTREQTFPPPGGATVVPVPTRRDRVTRALWLVLAVLVLAMAVMAAVGMVVNQRRAEARPQVSWARSVAPAPTLTPAGQYGTMRIDGSGLVTLDGYLTVRAPHGSGWTVGNDGGTTSLSPFLDPALTVAHASSVDPKGSNGTFLVGLPEQALIPETIDQTGPATTRALIEAAWGADEKEPTRVSIRSSRKAPAIGQPQGTTGAGTSLSAWRVTADFVTGPRSSEKAMVLDLTFLQVTPGQWVIIGMAMGRAVESELMPQLDAALASAATAQR